MAAYIIRTETPKEAKEFRITTFRNPHSQEFTDLIRVTLNNMLGNNWCIARVSGEGTWDHVRVERN